MEILSRVTAIILLILLAPLLTFIGLGNLIIQGRPIIYRQKRVGKHFKKFTIYKFRTMNNEISEQKHYSAGQKSTLNRWGIFLRKTKLDELPQLINIIKGDMRFIGPRPALHNQYDLIELRTQVGVHRLIPGITGWAQVNGRDELSIPAKVRMDEFYLKNQSFYLNMKIIIMTFIKVFKAEGVSK